MLEIKNLVQYAGVITAQIDLIEYILSSNIGDVLFSLSTRELNIIDYNVYVCILF